jgi:hypothetical protein
MRFMSKGISFGIDGMDAMTFLFTASRCALLRYTMKEKKTVSPGLSLAIRLKLLAPGIEPRSSATHSKYSSAPCFIHSRLPSCTLRCKSFATFHKAIVERRTPVPLPYVAASGTGTCIAKYQSKLLPAATLGACPPEGIACRGMLNSRPYCFF